MVESIFVRPRQELIWMRKDLTLKLEAIRALVKLSEEGMELNIHESDGVTDEPLSKNACYEKAVQISSEILTDCFYKATSIQTKWSIPPKWKISRGVDIAAYADVSARETPCLNVVECVSDLKKRIRVARSGITCPSRDEGIFDRFRMKRAKQIFSRNNVLKNTSN